MLSLLQMTDAVSAYDKDGACGAGPVAPVHMAPVALAAFAY